MNVSSWCCALTRRSFSYVQWRIDGIYQLTANAFESVHRALPLPYNEHHEYAPNMVLGLAGDKTTECEVCALVACVCVSFFLISFLLLQTHIHALSATGQECVFRLNLLVGAGCICVHQYYVCSAEGVGGCRNGCDWVVFFQFRPCE